MRSRDCAVLLCLLLVVACSPYNFSSQVADFSSGVDQVSKGFAATTAAMATDRSSEMETELVATHAKVEKSPDCVVAVNKAVKESAAPCLLYRTGGEPSAPSKVEVELKKTGMAITALQDYSHALAAVTKAEDRSAYDEAVGKLADSLGGLASAAGPSGAAAGGGVAAGVNLIGWLVGEQLDRQRFESLKRAVNTVGTAPPDEETTIEIITSGIGKGLRLARDERLKTLNRTLNVDLDQLGKSATDAVYRKRLLDAEALTASIEALREADPIGTADQLNTAHQALVTAVNDPSGNIPALVKALAAFSGKAEALESSLTTGAKAAGAADAGSAKSKPGSAKKGE